MQGETKKSGVEGVLTGCVWCGNVGIRIGGVLVVCKNCGSQRVIKQGHKELWVGGKKYRQQIHQCRDCGHKMLGDKGPVVAVSPVAKKLVK